MPEPAEVVIALGSNLGDREETLRGAVRLLMASPGLVLQGVSSVVETDPVGGPAQPDYLNAVVVAETTLAPIDMLGICHRIEQAFGRRRDQRWGARTLDLDLIVYGRPGTAQEVISEDPDLTLPHPRAHQRAFVLAPWNQVRPGAQLRLPSGQVRLVSSLLAQAPDREGVRTALRVGTLL